MRNASFHPHGTAFGNRNGQAVGVNAMGEKIHTMHKTGINAGYFDGHAESVKHDRIMEIQNSPQLIDRYFNPFK